MVTLLNRPLTFGDEEQIAHLKWLERQAKQKEATKHCSSCKGVGTKNVECDQCDGHGNYDVDCESCKV